MSDDNEIDDVARKIARNLSKKRKSRGRVIDSLGDLIRGEIDVIDIEPEKPGTKSEGLENNLGKDESESESDQRMVLYKK